MIDRTFKYILEDRLFKTLAAGRTDAMVSANEAAFELFLEEPINNFEAFLALFNHNLPQDIRALSIEEVTKEFNIIQNSKLKEYTYLFAFGNKFHPFCSPIMTTFLEDLDIKIMKDGAKLFEGHHNFKNYCYKAKDTGVYIREILTCEIIENNIHTASFFPEKTYILRVRGKGFMRNQIRLMMGILVKLGRGEVRLDFIENSLKKGVVEHMDYIAPASGLILNKIEFE